MLQEGKHDAVPGLRRLGKYELIARVGEGGMAEVFLARQTGPLGFQKVVVVKAIHPHLAREQEFIDMLLDEARVSALIKHPRVVDIYDLGIEDGTYFIAMEYIPGQPLSKMLAASKRLSRSLDIFSTAQIVADAADGLDAAHNLKSISGEPLELVHRDVSPGNIMVQYTGNVKLLDFGVSKTMGRISTTSSGQLKGKLGYVSPEQLEERALDRRSDVFALGIVLWESLALRRLFRATTPAGTIKKILDGNPPPPSEERRDVPAELDRICLKALAFEPKDRFQTAREMRQAILAFLRDSNYYGERNRIAAFMGFLFAETRKREEDLLRAVARATGEISVPSLKLPDDLDEDSSRRQRTVSSDLGPEIEVIVAPPAFGETIDDSAAEPLQSLQPEDTSIEIVTDDVEADAAAFNESSPSVPPHGQVFRPATHAGPLSRRVIWMAAAAAVAAGLVLFAVVGGDDSAPHTTAATAAAPPTRDESSPPAREQPVAAATAGTAAAEPSAPPAEVTPEETAPTASDLETSANAEPPVAAEPAVAKLSPAERRKMARQLYDEGTKLFVRGDLGHARTKFRKVLALDRDYAAAYRGLGLISEKQGQKARAVAYLRRYLRYRPSASDRAAIQARIDRLGGRR